MGRRLFARERGVVELRNGPNFDLAPLLLGLLLGLADGRADLVDILEAKPRPASAGRSVFVEVVLDHFDRGSAARPIELLPAERADRLGVFEAVLDLHLSLPKKAHLRFGLSETSRARNRATMILPHTCRGMRCIV